MRRGRATPRSFTRPAATAALGLVVLGACSSSDPLPPPPACPATLILDGAERTAAYQAGAEVRPSALRYIAVLTDLVSTCRYSDEGVEVDLTFSLTAERGPALADSVAEVTYFVATMGPDEQILTKEAFPAELDFEDGYAGARWAEQLTLLIRSITPETGADYTLFVGFQLDAEELARRNQPLLR